MPLLRLVTANLGAFDPIVPCVPQTLPPGLELDVVTVTDREFPPRSKAMTPRLQARIVKMCAHEMFPGADAYLWLDASFSLQRTDSVAWIWEALQQGDLVTWRHPARATVAEEADFLRLGVLEGHRYIVPRYAGELVEEQMTAIHEAGYPDTVLYASMLVAYWPRPHVLAMLRDWWWHTSRYHSVDQLAFPFVCWQHKVQVVTLGKQPYKSKYMTFVRRHHR